jgi:hypothetical protein
MNLFIGDDDAEVARWRMGVEVGRVHAPNQDGILRSGVRWKRGSIYIERQP